MGLGMCSGLGYLLHVVDDLVKLPLPFVGGHLVHFQWLELGLDGRLPLVVVDLGDLLLDVLGEHPQ